MPSTSRKACVCTKCRRPGVGFTLQTTKTIQRHIAADRGRHALEAAAAMAERSISPEAGPSRLAAQIDPNSLDGSGPDDMHASAPSDDGMSEYTAENAEHGDRSPTPIELDEEHDIMAVDNEDDDLLATHVYDTVPTARQPAPTVNHQPDNLPTYATRFVHHDLSASERMSFTQAALGSISGSTYDAVSAHLAYSAHLHSQLGQPMLKPTSDPHEAYERLGVNPDRVIVQYAMCSSNDCGRIAKVANLGMLDATGTHTGENDVECPGKLFDYQGSRRVPKKVMPFCPPSVMLQCFLRDPNFVRSIQLWRSEEPDNQVGDAPTVLLEQARDVDKVMNGIHDGAMWHSLEAFVARHSCKDSGPTTGVWYRDEMRGPSQQLVKLEFGIVAVLNVDWFGIHDVPNSSVGAVYLSVLNLPRHLFYRRSWTVLALILPGPRAPTHNAFQQLLIPLKRDLMRLEEGLYCFVSGHEHPEPVRMKVAFAACDLPASRKTTGTTSYNANKPCSHCRVDRRDLQKPETYDWRKLTTLAPNEALNAQFEWEYASPARRTTIEAQFGVQKSVLNQLTCFDPSTFGPPDSMHNIALGMTRALVLWIILDSGLLVDDDGSTHRKTLFEQALDEITWPSHVGRLARNVVAMLTSGGGANKVKADEMNRIRSALPLALWRALKEDGTNMISRSINSDRIEIYRTVVDFTVAARTLLGRTITVREAEEAQDQLSSVCRRLLRFGMKLTINWHLACHFVGFIKLYGPVGSYSTWCFERNNHVLANSRYFKGDQRQMPLTAARRWLREQLLVAVMENPSPDAGVAELEYLEDVKGRLQAKKIQGTLLLEEYRGRDGQRRVWLPKPTTTNLNLRRSSGNLYLSVLTYLQQALPQVRIRSETDIWGEGLVLRSIGHEEFSRVRFAGYRFTSGEYKRSRRDRWAIATVPGHAPDTMACRIESLFRIRFDKEGEDLEDELAVVAAVRFLDPAEELVPWSYRSEGLHQQLTHLPNTDRDPTIIPVCSLLSPVAVCKVEVTQGTRMVVISYDKDGVEEYALLDPEEEADEDNVANVLE